MVSVLTMLPMIFVSEHDENIIAFNLDLPFPIEWERLMDDNRLSALGYTLLRREIHKWGKTTSLPESFAIELSDAGLDQLLIRLETDLDALMDWMFLSLPKRRQHYYQKIESRTFCQYKSVGVNHYALLLTRQEDERLHISMTRIDNLQYSFMAA